MTQRFQIVRGFPHFDNRDAICGWSYERLPYAYQTQACAHKIAARFDSDGMDETVVMVVPYGGSVTRPLYAAWPPISDPARPTFEYDMPF